MFDLDQEIDRWARSVHDRGCNRMASVDELKDHLHCEIDPLRAEGMSDEEAFHLATERIGEAAELKDEHGKNRSLLSVACQESADEVKPTMTTRQLAVFAVASLVLLAITTAAITALMKDSDQTAAVLSLVYFLWLAPFLMIPNLRRSAREEWACLRRRFSRKSQASG